MGIASAVRPYSGLDYATGVVGLLGVSLPTFFTGLVFIYVFSLKLGWLPSGGMTSLGGAAHWTDRLRHLILPTAVLALANLGLMLRLVRSSTLEVLRQDFVRTARAKGLGSWQVLVRHVLRNTLLPVITMAGLQLPALIAGSIITEQVFQWPGMGWLTIQAILGRDYPTLMGLNLLAAVMVLAGNLLADILYGVADRGSATSDVFPRNGVALRNDEEKVNRVASSIAQKNRSLVRWGVRPAGDSYWALVVRRFLRHRLAVTGLVVLILMSLAALAAPSSRPMTPTPWISSPSPPRPRWNTPWAPTPWGGMC